MVAVGKSRHGRKSFSGKSKRYLTGVTRYNQAVIDIPPHAHKVLGQYRSRDKLLKLLRFIECRATFNAGETKIFTKMMMDHLSVSERTIYNYLKILQNHRYISVITDNVYGKKGYFYSVRIIRANRVVLRFGARVQPGKIFKVDIRPKVSMLGYLPGTPSEYMVTGNPPSSWDLAKKGLYDPGVESMCRETRELAEVGDQAAIKMMGTKFKIDQNGVAFR